MGAHQQFPAARILPQQANAQAEFVAHAACVRRAGRIVQRRIARKIPPGKAVAEAVTRRGPIGAAKVHAAEIAIAGPHIAALALARPDRNEIDRAARGIAAIQRALRALQHLDPLQVVQHQAGLDVGREIDAIGIDGRRRRRQRLMVHRADAADLEGHLRAIGHRRIDAGQQVGHILCPQIGIRQPQRIGPDNADRHGNVSQWRSAGRSGRHNRVQAPRRVAGLSGGGGKN